MKKKYVKTFEQFISNLDDNDIEKNNIIELFNNFKFKIQHKILLKNIFDFEIIEEPIKIISFYAKIFGVWMEKGEDKVEIKNILRKLYNKELYDISVIYDSEKKSYHIKIINK